jgi:hypothetical protein
MSREILLVSNQPSELSIGQEHFAQTGRLEAVSHSATFFTTGPWKDQPTPETDRDDMLATERNLIATRPTIDTKARWRVDMGKALAG